MLTCICVRVRYFEIFFGKLQFSLKTVEIGTLIQHRTSLTKDHGHALTDMHRNSIDFKSYLVASLPKAIHWTHFFFPLFFFKFVQVFSGYETKRILCSVAADWIAYLCTGRHYSFDILLEVIRWLITFYLQTKFEPWEKVGDFEITFREPVGQEDIHFINPGFDLFHICRKRFVLFMTSSSSWQFSTTNEIGNFLRNFGSLLNMMSVDCRCTRPC